MIKLNILIAAFAILILTSISALACDISFEVLDGKKATYAQNDVLTAKVKVVLTHRSCSTSINKTELKPKGLEIVTATKWAEKTPGTWERKVKMKITDAKSGKATLNAVRECEKDGGNVTLTLKTK